jgi:hypothetical protein
MVLIRFRLSVLFAEKTEGIFICTDMMKRIMVECGYGAAVVITILIAVVRFLNGGEIRVISP